MVIAGQGTLRLPLQQDTPSLRLFVPVGGGGLAAGVAVPSKQLMPQIKAIAVEAEDSACRKALNAGHPVDLPRVGLFAEGVAANSSATEPSVMPASTTSSPSIAMPICAVMKDLFEDVRAVAEPSGALALAGMKRYRPAQHSRRRPAHILCGANVNFHGLRYVGTLRTGAAA
ncbi:pyridoxal-phosphate dependent enzyme [Shigella flexneri]